MTGADLHEQQPLELEVSKLAVDAEEVATEDGDEITLRLHVTIGLRSSGARPDERAAPRVDELRVHPEAEVV
jgi:hypothetical protein